MTTGKLLLGALACVAAGAAIGILFAPDKGVETRRKIARKGEDALKSVGETVDHKFDEMRTKLTQTLKRQKPEGQAVNSVEPQVIS